MSPARQGYTLVEILAVSAIFTALSVLSFSAFSRARATGQKTSCAANLHALSLAIRAYAEDNNDYYPSSFRDQKGCGWSQKVLPYVRNPSTFLCPSDNVSRFSADCGRESIEEPEAETRNGSYGFTDMRTRDLRLKSTRLRQPAEFVIVADSLAGGSAVLSIGRRPSLDMRILQLGGLEFRHSQGANALYADGHVQWHPAEFFLDKSVWTARGLF